MITSIAFTVYPVSNMERARAFYEHVLGLHASYHYQDAWVEYDLSDETFAITTTKMGHTLGAKEAIVAFEVSDLDAFVHKIKGDPCRSSRKRSRCLSAGWRASKIRTATTSRSTRGTCKNTANSATVIAPIWHFSSLHSPLKEIVSQRLQEKPMSCHLRESWGPFATVRLLHPVADFHKHLPRPFIRQFQAQEFSTMDGESVLR